MSFAAAHGPGRYSGGVDRASTCRHRFPPAIPGIFGIGFTDLTDTSARLVFTTSEPMTSTVVVEQRGKEFSRSSQPTPEEIHAVDLSGLAKGDEYLVTITAVTAQGQISHFGEVLPQAGVCEPRRAMPGPVTRYLVQP